MILFKLLPNKSLSVVFPELPVIAIALIFETFLIVLEYSDKNFKEFLTFTFLIWLDLKFLSTIAKVAPFLIDSLANLLPSNFLPFIPKKISFFLIVLEFIDVFLITDLLFIIVLLYACLSCWLF